MPPIFCNVGDYLTLALNSSNTGDTAVGGVLETWGEDVLQVSAIDPRFVPPTPLTPALVSAIEGAIAEVQATPSAPEIFLGYQYLVPLTVAQGTPWTNNNTYQMAVCLAFGPGSGENSRRRSKTSPPRTWC